LPSIQSRQEAETILAAYLKEESVIQFLMKGLYRKDDNQFSWRFNLNDIITNYENILSFESKDGAIFEGQTLFIRGEKSNYIQDKDRSQMLKMFPNMQLETILGAGHWLHAEKPKEFIDLVKEFLKE
jgi:pimeloyl-ACP methyl ester carboxylesterase